MGAAKAQESFFLEPVKNNPFQNFQDQIPIISYTKSLESPDFKAYLEFYELNFPEVIHFAGLTKTGSGDIFTHVFKPGLKVPQKSAGVVVALHGYFVHSGQLKHLIKALLDAHYTVVTLDLPGHGLSSGNKASIDDFSNYAHMIEALTPEIVGHLQGPYYLLGHSTGGAGVWEYLLRNPKSPYAKAVLAAPLVRSYLWELSSAGFYLGNGWLTELPRIMRPTSTDPEFMALTRRDPLQYPGTPVRWVQSLIVWNDHVIPHFEPSQISLFIAQGQEDTVVDWQYNIPFLQKKFPNAQVSWFPNAKHDIVWEKTEIRNALFQEIIQFLKR